MLPAATNGLALGWDSLQPEAPPERRRVAGQAPALSPQQPPRERAGCERIAVVLVHAVPCNVGGAITGGGAGLLASGLTSTSGFPKNQNSLPDFAVSLQPDRGECSMIWRGRMGVGE